MAGELVFVTGATGFVGFAVLLNALQAGYRVRISVRHSSQIAKIQDHPSIVAFHDRIESVIVPDITADRAFDSALRGVTYIQHVASPLPSHTEDPEKDIIIPAIKGTVGILNSALRTGSVRRVVVTSSLVAIIPNWALTDGDHKNIYNPSSRIQPLPAAPWGNFAVSYRAAKSLALDATDSFIAEKNPSFTVVNVMPGYVIGANQLATDTASLGKGSNALVIGIVMGQKQSVGRPCLVSDVRDVARVQVEALDEMRVQGNQSILLKSGEVAFDDANEIIKRKFPAAVASGTLPLGGSVPSVYRNVDVSESVKLFGTMISYEESVKSLIGQYMALKSNELSL